MYLFHMFLLLYCFLRSNLDRKRSYTLFSLALIFSSGYALFSNTQLYTQNCFQENVNRAKKYSPSRLTPTSLVAPGNGLKGTMCPAGWEIIWLSWTLDRVSGPAGCSVGVQEIFSGPGWFWLMISRGRELICVWLIKRRPSPRAHRHWWHTRVSLPSVCHWCELDTGGQRRCVRAGEIFHSLSTNHFRCVLCTAVW